MKTTMIGMLLAGCASEDVGNAGRGAEQRGRWPAIGRRAAGSAGRANVHALL
jgi:hypothetical protein